LVELEPDQTRTYAFRWSGGNDHEARLKAASDLAHRLEGLAAAFPTTRFLLVGHSHGGNVALAAMKAIPAAQRVGVVCLATPFYNIAERTLLPLVVMAGLAYVAIAAALFAAALVFAEPLFHFMQRFDLITSIARTHPSFAGALRLYFAGASVLAFLMFGSVLMLPVAFMLRFAFEDARQRAVDTWAPLLPTDTPTLSVWLGPDEAYLPLRLLERIEAMVHAGWRLAARRVAPLGFGVASVWGGWLVWSKFTVEGPIIGLHVTVQILKALAISCIVGAVAFSAFWLGSRGMRLFALFMEGRRTARLRIWMSIGYQRVPGIPAELVESVRLPLSMGSTLSPIWTGVFNHSRPWADARTASLITDWYRRRCRGSDQSSEEADAGAGQSEVA
jgi:pimeloyl-ACP methyl ester carboxylesterase